MRSWLTRGMECDTFTYMASLTLRIPDSLERQLLAASKERGISKSDIAREAIERDMRVQSWQKLRDQFRPRLEKQRVFTEDDVFQRLNDSP
jgi:predicted transcriptional regulator